MADLDTIERRLGLLSGGLTGLAFAAGLWGPDAVGLWQAHLALWYPPMLAAAAGLVTLGALAGWLAARIGRTLLGALIWLIAAILVMFIAGHLPFEGRTLLAWLADRRFWGLPIYPFDSTAQARLVVGSFFPALVLAMLGLVQDYRLESIRSSLNAQRLSARAWLLLLLPLPVVFGVGLMADEIVNRPLREPVTQVAQIIATGRNATVDLDALSQQTGINYSAIVGVRSELSDRFELLLGEIDLGDEQMVVVAHFDNGAWINCSVLAGRVSFCSDAQTSYTNGLQILLAGRDIGQCQDCQMAVSADWQAWLRVRGRLTGTPQITRLAQQGSYVLMRAANPGSGYAVDCMFRGNSTVTLLSCQEAAGSQ